MRIILFNSLFDVPCTGLCKEIISTELLVILFLVMCLFSGNQEQITIPNTKQKNVVYV